MKWMRSCTTAPWCVACWHDYQRRPDVLQVHWVYPYEKLRAANVLGTMVALRLAATGRPKMLCFVSSTSVLDAEHYVRLPGAVSESDPLDGAQTGLKVGYGQTKWVAERVLMEAARRGLAVSIVRPGYVVGDSTSAGMSRAAPCPRPILIATQSPIPTTSSGGW